MGVNWILPKGGRGTIHLNMSTAAEATAAETAYRACKPTEGLLLHKVLVGEGMQAARLTRRSWCTACEAILRKRGMAAPAVDGVEPAPPEPPVKRRRAAAAG